MSQVHRSRWAAVGAAVAVTLGAGTIGVTHATTSSGERAVFTPIAACRMLDTRPNNVPNHIVEPLGGNDAYTFDLSSDNGRCDAIADATGLSLNVTAVNASTATYLSFVPGKLTPPTNGLYTDSSNLNPAPNQPPTPNAVEVDLDSDQLFSVYNAYGTVDVIIDIVGYYTDHDHDDRYYTKDQVEGSLASKANSSSVYTKTEADSRFTTWAYTIDVPAGGTARENGAALAAALEQIDDSGEPRWLVRLDAGDYDVDGSFSVPNHVRIIGAGHQNTIIMAPVYGSTAQFADLSLDSVEALSGTITLDNVTANTLHGVFAGFEVRGSQVLQGISASGDAVVKITDSTVFATGTAAIAVSTSSDLWTPIVQIRGSDVASENGPAVSLADDAELSVRDSHLWSASHRAIESNDESHFTVEYSHLEGNTVVVQASGTSSGEVLNSRLGAGTVNGAVTCAAVTFGTVFQASGCS